MILTKVNASHRKSTQVQASPGQTESQVDPSFQLASTCVSVWPGLYAQLSNIRASYLGRYFSVETSESVAKLNLTAPQKIHRVIVDSTFLLNILACAYSTFLLCTQRCFSIKYNSEIQTETQHSLNLNTMASGLLMKYNTTS